jgi:hypothetical protein
MVSKQCEQVGSTWPSTAGASHHDNDCLLQALTALETAMDGLGIEGSIASVLADA